jgi:hypothetical protein
MSSTVSTTEVQTISKKVMTPRKADDKTQRLVRTSSLEKIRRFNSFICSQQYYVLPALLAWLKSSQTVLQSSTEKTIFFFPLSPLHPLPLQALPVGVQGDRLQWVAPGPETVPGDLFAQVGGVRDGSGAECTALFVFLFAVQHARAQRVGLPDSLLVLHNLFERQLGLFRAEKEQ